MHIHGLARRSLGREFGWLWAAYAASAYGSGLALGAFPLIAVLALRSGPAEVSVLSAVGPAVGVLIAVPLGPWVEFRRKRPVMIAMDLSRFGVLATIPVAYAYGLLSFVQLLIISAVIAAAKITFNAAGGTYLKTLVRSDDLLVANARFESTNWSSLAVGPPLGGAAVGLFGPVATVAADAVSYLLSALGITAIRGHDHVPRRAGKGRIRAGDLVDGWRHILTDPVLRALWFNNMLVGGLIMATEPLLAVLLLRQLGFPPWQYGLAFAAPCVGGLIGSRLARRVVARYGHHRVLLTVGTLRAVWLIGLAFIRPGAVGLLTVIAVELAVIISMSLYSPVLATYRIQHTPQHRVARVLSAWSIGSQASIAIFTALGGLLAGLTSTRSALAAAGLLILASPLLLPRRPNPAPVAGNAESIDGRRRRRVRAVPGAGAEEAQTVEADDDGGSFVTGHAEWEREVTDEVPGDEGGDEGGGDGQVGDDQAAGAAREDEGGRDDGQVVGDDDGVRGVEREVGSGAAHGDADIGGGQGGGVVDAVADHGHLPAGRPGSVVPGRGGLEAADGGDLALGEKTGVDVGDGEGTGEPAGGVGVIAGEQGGRVRGDGGQSRDGRSGFGTGLVGDGEQCRGAVVDEHGDGGVPGGGDLGGEGVRVRCPGGVRTGGQRGGRADPDVMAGDVGGDSAAGRGGEAGGGGGGDAAGVRGGDDGAGEMVLAGVLRRGGQPQDVRLVVARERTDLGEVGAAAGEGAGLVEGDLVGGAELFHDDRGLDEHAVASGVGDGGQQRRHRGEDHRAG